MRLCGAGSLRPNLCGVVGREIFDVRLRKIPGIPSRFLSEIVFERTEDPTFRPPTLSRPEASDGLYFIRCDLQSRLAF